MKKGQAVQKSPREGAQVMLSVAIVLLLLFNGIYWTAKFFPGFWPGLTSFRTVLLGHWGLLMFLEFLGVVSVFVDMVVRWDGFAPVPKRFRLALSFVLFAFFVARLIHGVIDMYMTGEVQ